MLKKFLPELTAAGVLVGALAAVPAIAVLKDIRSDRRHSIIITERVPLYAAPRFDCGREQPVAIGFASPNDNVRVLRIRYGKDCQTVKVAVGDGPSGWLLAAGPAVRVTEPEAAASSGPSSGGPN